MSSIEVIITLISLIIVYHLLMIFIRDRKYAKPFKVLKEPEKISLKDLKDIPLVNIIVPAWNEGEIFRQCLVSATKLKYPKIKVIVNAGGSEETKNIADSFKRYDNFIIIPQEGGGKIKALNECLPYISEGVLYLVDADVYFTDEVLIRLLYPITNLNEKVSTAGHRPLKYQENKDFAKYLFVNHNLSFRKVFETYGLTWISGANTIIKFDVLKTISKFSEDRLWSEDVSRGYDIMRQGIRIYASIGPRSLIYSHESDTYTIYFKQRVRWIENMLNYSQELKKRNFLIKFVILCLFSSYILILPLLFFIHISFMLIEIYILMSLYLKRIRRILFFKKTRPNFFKKFTIFFYFKIVFYIFIEAVINIYTLFDYVFFRKNLKKRRNLL